MLKLEIVTPEKKVLETDADSVTVPTASGEAGILPHHAPLVSALKPGILTYSVKGNTEKLAISGGFVEVSSDNVSVLVDSAENSEEIDVAAAKEAREAAEKAISSAGIVEAETADLSREALEHANARVQLASGR